MPSRDKNQGAYRSGEVGEKSLLGNPGSELQLGRENDKEKVPR